MQVRRCWHRRWHGVWKCRLPSVTVQRWRRPATSEKMSSPLCLNCCRIRTTMSTKQNKVRRTLLVCKMWLYYSSCTTTVFCLLLHLSGLSFRIIFTVHLILLIWIWILLSECTLGWVLSSRKVRCDLLLERCTELVFIWHLPGMWTDKASVWWRTPVKVKDAISFLHSIASFYTKFLREACLQVCMLKSMCT